MIVSLHNIHEKKENQTNEITIIKNKKKRKKMKLPKTQNKNEQKQLTICKDTATKISLSSLFKFSITSRAENQFHKKKKQKQTFKPNIVTTIIFSKNT